MAHVILLEPSLPDTVRYIRPLPMRRGVDNITGLEGLKIGKFFSRAFDIKGIVKKAPRILAGAGTALALGGTGTSGWSAVGTALAGGIVAAIPKRKAGTSLLTDIGVGMGYGAIPGVAIGTYRGLTSPQHVSVGQIGLAGKAAQVIQEQFFPEAAAARSVYGPVPAATVAQASGVPTGAVLKSAIPTASKGSSWLETAGEVLKASVPLVATVVAGQMQPQVSDQGYVELPGNPNYYTPELTASRMGGETALPAYGYDAMYGVPGDIGTAQAVGSGGLVPIVDPETGEVKYVQPPTFWEQYKIPILLGGGVILVGLLFYQQKKKRGVSDVVQVG